MTMHMEIYPLMFNLILSGESYRKTLAPYKNKLEDCCIGIEYIMAIATDIVQENIGINIGDCKEHLLNESVNVVYENLYDSIEVSVAEQHDKNNNDIHVFNEAVNNNIDNAVAAVYDAAKEMLMSLQKFPKNLLASDTMVQFEELENSEDFKLIFMSPDEVPE